jgi:hypothetical protein
MLKFIKFINKTVIGKIFDFLFLGEYFLPKFSLYLIIPTIIIIGFQAYGFIWATKSFINYILLLSIFIFFIGAIWHFYKTEI